MHAVIRIKEQKERAESGPVMCFQTDTQTDTRTQAHGDRVRDLTLLNRPNELQSAVYPNQVKPMSKFSSKI